MDVYQLALMHIPDPLQDRQQHCAGLWRESEAPNNFLDDMLSC